MFKANSKVRHAEKGMGVVLADMGTTVIVRFENGIESCLPKDLKPVLDVGEAIRLKQPTPMRAMLPLLQARCIKSANDQWGVFARSKIDLLPHQLWVCRQARLRNPCRLLVADDVGLGKTIEAGMILSSMLSSGTLRRLLILTPASLAGQWRQRMYEMFDIRAALYCSQLDTKTSHFWELENCVVASIDTLKLDRADRMNRFLSAEAWDLVVVDEAHHLNTDVKGGATQGCKLLMKMEEQRKIGDMLFFTGTPHKGKDFSFLSLMKLLAPDVFNPRRPMKEQLKSLPDYMIRNNKYNVTDLNGNRLFRKPKVASKTYAYSPEEREFYDSLTNFISNGMAYADSLNRETGSVVMFVLVTMQKLASSSVAAVSNAIANRIRTFGAASSEKKKLIDEYERIKDMDDECSLEIKTALEVKIVQISEFVQIGKNEKAVLENLLRLAEKVRYETKIRTILETVESEYPNEPIVFFTEYKATQAVLIGELMKLYGENSVTFINGDERLENVAMPDGTRRTISLPRTEAQRKFNKGEYKYIVSTEAAGEGIDLQENCHVLFHVDLPWNPMRLQQRVGRLNRYGQTRQVEVCSFRNPDTVESRIWQKLNDKLESIKNTFDAVMEEKEDLFDLVLGTAPQFDKLFSQAPQDSDDETLSKWFDANTGKFGGKDAYEAARMISGSAAKFDYGQVSGILPKVDLSDLLPFWKNILSYKEKRVFEDEDGALTFNIPDDWFEYGMVRKYERLQLKRNAGEKNRILGSGHKVFDKGVQKATEIEGLYAVSGTAQHDYFFYNAYDQVTDSSKEKGVRVYACEVDDGRLLRVMPDWEALKMLNRLSPSVSGNGERAREPDAALLRECEQGVIECVRKDDFKLTVPVATLFAAILKSPEEENR